MASPQHAGPYKARRVALTMFISRLYVALLRSKLISWRSYFWRDVSVQTTVLHHELTAVLFGRVILLQQSLKGHTARFIIDK
jgi:hypothetical protein